MAERIEALTEEHLEECAHLLVSAFNSEPWNESWTLETAEEELRWTLSVPGYEGFVSRGEGYRGSLRVTESRTAAAGSFT